MLNSRSKESSPKQSGKDSMFGRFLNDNFFNAVIYCKPSTSSHPVIPKTSREVRHCKPAHTFNLGSLIISNVLRECKPCREKFGQSLTLSVERQGNWFSPSSLDNLIRLGRLSNDRYSRAMKAT
ncbi:hypothetical protein V8G54_030999 [Vigna mungo]|uniref:Uncharacterized protein n=1 Tax=Vigna mungo TaxID=3915 RepID=A0AAQ3RNH0_VIGMU